MVTILFADLSGFTRLAHDSDPEDVSDAINICFEHLNPIITKHLGVIHKYEGDLVIALFGVPTAHEDDPERAIESSLEMLRIVPGINRALTTRLKTKTNIDLHIGINSGLVALRQMGSKEKKEWTVMGDAVNLASRLKDVAKRGEIIVSEIVFRSSRYLFDYEALPPVIVKGIEEPVRIFKPIRIKDKPDPKRGIKGLYSPLVGRNKEFALLKETVEKLNPPHPSLSHKGGGIKGGVVFILGDAGLGKSRLWEELKKNISSEFPQSISVLEAQCLSGGETLAYRPFLQILKSIYGIADSDPVKMIQNKLLKKTKELFSKDWENIVPYIAQLFSIRFSDELSEKVRYLDPQGLKTQILLSVRKLFATLSKIKPLILVIEDYHWIDPASLELLEFIFESPEFHSESQQCSGATRDLTSGQVYRTEIKKSHECDRDNMPLLFLALSRPEKEKECYKTKERLKKKLSKNFQEIVLQPLDNKSSSELTYNLLAVLDVPEEFKDKILSKAEGNPFYLEEILRSLIDNGILVFESGIWNLKAKIANITIPDTVQAVIASRLDRLEKDVREVLQMASVIGRSFYERVLEYLSGMDNLMLSLYIATLEAFEFIKEFKRVPELEYLFKHPLVWEVAYNTLLKKKQRELHHKVGQAMENLFPQRIDEFSELLSQHHYLAENWVKAYEYSIKSAKKAVEAYNNKEAIKFYDRAIACARLTTPAPPGSLQDANAEAGRANNQELITALKEKSVVLNLIGENEKALEEINEGITLSKESRDKRSCADCLLQLSWIYASISQYKKTKNLAEEALLLYQELKNKKGEANSLNHIGYVHDNLGDYGEALKYHTKSLKIQKEIGNRHGEAISLNNIGTVYADLGNYKKAFKYFHKSLEIREAIDDRGGAAISLNNIGFVYSNLGNYEETLKYYTKSLKIKKEIGDRYGEAISLNNIGNLYMTLGKNSQAGEYLQKAEESTKEIGAKDLLIRITVLWGELALAEFINQTSKGRRQKTELRGQKIEEKIKQAIEYAEKALKLAGELNSKSGKAEALLLHARIEMAGRQGDMETRGQGEGKFKEAIKLFEELKQPFELAKAYYYYSERLKLKAEMEKAKKYLQKAKRIFEKIGAKGWLKKINTLIQT